MGQSPLNINCVLEYEYLDVEKQEHVFLKKNGGSSLFSILLSLVVWYN